MIGIILALLLPLAGSPDTVSAPLEVEVCRFELTELGRRARFNFCWFYVATTDASGAVVEVRRLETKSRSAFVKESEFEPCIRSWRLYPNREFTIVLTGGTTSAAYSIRISGEDLYLVLRMPK